MEFSSDQSFMREAYLEPRFGSSQTCRVCYNLDSHSPATRERLRYGTSPRPFGEYRFEIYYDKMIAAAANGCKCCSVIKQCLDGEGIKDLGRERLWLFGWQGHLMDITPRNSPVMPKHLELYTVEDRPSPWPEIGPAGHVPEDPTSTSSFDQVRRWIEDCAENHTLCRLVSNPTLPTRVIDVGSSQHGQNPSLYVSGGKSARYAALSYCWGGEVPFKTTKGTLDQMQHGISMAKLPQTIQDAIHVTRELGLQYLWVDAYCIIQDDPQDWERESSKMASIYGSAYLTISATSSRTVDAGFLAPRPTARENKFVDDDGREYSVYTRERLNHAVFRKSDPDGLENYPTMTRGWCLQERILSTRVLHYTETEMIWDCKTRCQCECGGYQDDGRETFIHVFNKLVENIQAIQDRQNSPFTSTATNQAISDRVNDEVEIRDEVSNWWSLILEHHSRTQLTKEKDRLPSLSGLAHRLQEVGLGRYLAGLWEVDLARGMLWHGLGLVTVSSEFTAPSFSPLSRPGRSSHKIPLSATYEQCITVVEASCSPSGLDPTGAVSSGYIKLIGPLVTAIVETVTVRHIYTEAKCRAPSGTILDPRWDPDTRDSALSILPGQNIYILQMFLHDYTQHYYPDRQTDDGSSALILIRDKEDEEVFYRIGANWACKKELFAEAVTTTIILK